MKISLKLTNKIVKALRKSVNSKGLNLVKSDIPLDRNHKQEWVIRDSEDYAYGCFGISDVQYLYAVPNKEFIPSHDAEEKLSWLKSEMPRVINSFLADSKDND